VGEDHTIKADSHCADIMADKDLLISANLIHRHLHRHGKVLHEHLHAHSKGHAHVHEDALSP